MTIDMHAHWNPPALIEPFRARSTPPLIETDAGGVEVLRSHRGSTPISEIFDDVETRLAEMDRQGVSTAVLSLFGMHQWIERLDVEESVPLTRIYNDHVSEICRDNGGRFAAYASLPQADMDAAVAGAHFGLYFNQGQCCCAGSRVFVEESVHDEFIGRVTEMNQSTQVGDPFDPQTTQGPQVDQNQMDKILRYIEVGKSGGANCLTGDNRIGDKGYFVEPVSYTHLTLPTKRIV